VAAVSPVPEAITPSVDVHEVEVRIDAPPRADPVPEPALTRPTTTAPKAADGTGPVAPGPDLSAPLADRPRPGRGPAPVVAAAVRRRAPTSDVPDLPGGPAVPGDAAPADPEPILGVETAASAVADPETPALSGETDRTAPAPGRTWRPPLPARAAWPDALPAPRTGRRAPAADDRPPTVTVTIGRVEVRRPPPPPPLPPPAPEPVPAGPRPLSLAEYLDQRGRT
jgi:hypothetical protein